MKSAFSRRHIFSMATGLALCAALPVPRLLAASQTSLQNPTQTLAAMLAKARLSRTRLPSLDEALRPKTIEETYRVQDALIEILGGRGGYKANMASVDQAPLQGMIRSPLPKRDIYEDGASMTSPADGVIAMEGEIAYRVMKDLPPRPTPYSEEEVLAAVEACPGIEILWLRFDDMKTVGGHALIADLGFNGSYIIGAPIENWRQRLPENPPMKMISNGKTIFETDAAKHSSADRNVLPLIWLANEGTHRDGGLKAGQVVSTGNYTGGLFFKPPVAIELQVGNLATVKATVNAP